MNLVFNNMLQHYYSILGGQHKDAYKEIYVGLMTFKDTIAITATTDEDVYAIFNYVLLDNPIIFYASTYSYSVDSSNYVNTISPVYIDDLSLVKKYINSISEYLKKFDAIKSMNDFDKEVYVHDFCIQNLKYDVVFNAYSQTIIGAIFYNQAVCAGIAKFVKLVFDYVGLKSIVVSGDAKCPSTGEMQGHAWNVVEVNNNYYHLDVTFDMTITDKNTRYDYFNLTDVDIMKDHAFEKNMPVCKSIAHNYFDSKSIHFKSNSELKAYLRQSLKKRLSSVFFKLSYNQDEYEILQLAQIQFPYILFVGNKIEIRSNKQQGVYELIFNAN